MISRHKKGCNFKFFNFFYRDRIAPMNCGYSVIALTPLLYCYKNGDGQRRDKEIFKIIHCVCVWSLWACAHVSVCILSVGMRTCECLYTVCVHVSMHTCECLYTVCVHVHM